MKVSELGFSGIYQIRNVFNGKLYIGSAVDMRARWRVHLHYLRKGNHHSVKLQRAWNKHGEDAFVFECIEVVGQKKDLLSKEQFWLDKEASCDHGYNINPIAGSSLGRKFRPETIAKMSANRRGRTHSDEARQKMSSTRRGKPWTAARRASHKPSVRQEISNETREKMSQSQLARFKRERSERKLHAWCVDNGVELSQ